MSNRTVRHNGFIVREQDVINHLANTGCTLEQAQAIAAKSPTWTGNPLSGAQYTAAVDRMNRRDDVAIMSDRRY